MSNRVIIGKLGAAYGVRGWLHLISYTNPTKNILNYTQWQIKHHGQWLTIDVEASKAHNKGFIAKLAGIDHRELAREYTNDAIAVDRTELPATADDEYYWQDLNEATVITEEGIQLGTIKEIMATGSNDVLVVIGERERLIPYIKDVIINVDITKKIITVRWDPEF